MLRYAIFNNKKRKRMYIFTDASTNQAKGITGVGFVVKDDEKRWLFSGRQGLICHNNNSAELWAIAFCCQLLKKNGYFEYRKKLNFYVDSKTALYTLFHKSSPEEIDELSMDALKSIQNTLLEKTPKNQIKEITFYQIRGHHRCSVPFIAKSNHEADSLATKARLDLERLLSSKHIKQKKKKAFSSLQEPFEKLHQPIKIGSFQPSKKTFNVIMLSQKQSLENCS